MSLSPGGHGSKDPMEALMRRASLPSPTSAFHTSLMGSGLLRSGDSVVQTVRLESAHPDRQRFLCIVSSSNRDKEKSHLSKRSTLSGAIAFGGGDHDKMANLGKTSKESEFCLLGVDRCPRRTSLKEDGSSNKRELETTVGLVARLMWNVHVSLDGDGGFSLVQPGRHLIFKPVSVQALWTVIQALHMIIARLAPLPENQDNKRLSERSPLVSDWDLAYPVNSPQSCINEWHAMADLLVKRPPSPDREGLSNIEGENPEVTIKSRLRQIMKSADLDSITSKGIRTQLEAEMGESLEKYKTFIDKEMLVILGQMDPASKITDYLYLGSEWNASNLEELRQNGITHILNVTREIDNFFPAVFTYKNVREYDEEATELLKYLDRTYKFIRGAKETGGKVLVHCKMGISRSATVTIAYVMKEYCLNLEESLKMVKGRRNIVKPNKSFLRQLEVYEGILGAIRHRHTYFGLFRSKSESSLVPSPVDLSGAGDDDDDDIEDFNEEAEEDKKRKGSSPVQIRVDIKALATFFSRPQSEPTSFSRPKSWSPSEQLSQYFFPRQKSNELRVPGEDCQCFGEMSHLDASSAEDPSAAEATAVVEAKNPVMQPVNSSLFDPDCDCDMELELKVPEVPVSVADTSPDQDTDSVVQTISNVPLQARTRLPEIIQKQIVSPAISIVEHRDQQPQQQQESEQVVPPAPPPPPSSRQDETVGGTEDELSVKHLASMFDYNKIGTVPIRPCSARLEDCQLFQRAKRLAGEVPDEESNC